MRTASTIAAISALALLSVATPSEAGEVLIADSSRDFSSVQGNFGWFYGYCQDTYNPAAFLQMQEFTDNYWWVDSAQPAPQYWTSLAREATHPNGLNTTFGRSSSNQWAVRRWQSWLAGSVRVEVLVHDDNTDASSNGQRVWLYHNNVYKSDITTPAVFADERTMQMNVVVGIGDTIDVALDPVDGNDWADSLLIKTRIYLLGDQADHFPKIEILSDQTGLFVRWPKASYGFALQDSEAATSGWANVTGGITADAIYYYYRFTPAGPARFFRLSQSL